jgi:MFS family permease
VGAIAFYTPLLGMLFFAPLYMQGLLGYSPVESGAAIVPMGVLVIVSANVAGRVMGRIGQRPLIVVGLALIAVGVGLLWSRAPLHGSYWTAVLPGVAVMSIGQGLAFAAITAASMTGIPQEQHGVASAFNVTAQQIGGSIGVAALVTIAHSFTSGSSPVDLLSGYHAGFAVGGAVGAAGAVLIALGGVAGLRKVRLGHVVSQHGSAVGAPTMISPTPCCANGSLDQPTTASVG